MTRGNQFPGNLKNTIGSRPSQLCGCLVGIGLLDPQNGRLFLQRGDTATKFRPLAR